jgi:hypothetical protein
VSYGYEPWEVEVEKWSAVKPSFKINLWRKSMGLRIGQRRPVLVSLGPHFHSASLPHPNLGSGTALVAGVLKRFAFQPPEPKDGILDELAKFITEKILCRLTPLNPETDVSFHTWIGNKHDPEWRRQELTDVYHKQVVFGPATMREAKVKTFMKDEGYVKYKQPRAINARSDPMKVRLGPIFHAIEDEVYKMPEFIKHIPVKDRGKYIEERLYRVGCKYLTSDFTSYESLFTKMLMQHCERLLYDHMTKYLPDHREFMAMFDKFLLGKNNLISRYFKAQIEATRMSGEMCTSLGNGFSTMCFCYFIFDKVGFLEPELVVEGDDNAASGYGTAPTKEDFASLGLVIKIEEFQIFSDMSFCGLLFDQQAKQIVTDPLKVMATFGWGPKEYVNARTSKLMSLLRCKSLSFAHQYPACPVVTALAHYGLRVTAGYDVRAIAQSRTFDSYKREQLRQAMSAPLVREEIHPNTRALVERVFNISIYDQFRIERMLDTKKDLEPIIDPVLPHLVHSDWIHYYHAYTRNIDPKAAEAGYYWPKINRMEEEVIEECASRPL